MLFITWLALAPSTPAQQTPYGQDQDIPLAPARFQEATQGTISPIDSGNSGNSGNLGNLSNLGNQSQDMRLQTPAIPQRPVSSEIISSGSSGNSPDITDRIKMVPGLAINFPIRNGLDTRWNVVGNYNFIATIDYTDLRGYRFHWNMSPPANASGARAVDAEDIAQAYKVSLFYPDNEMSTLVGFTSIVRISDSLYRALKEGRRTRFALDGPQSPQLLSRNTMPVAHEIAPLGIELINIGIDNRVVTVRAIHARTDSGWSYWILDNAEFPLMLQGTGPFQWDALSLAYTAGGGPFGDGANNGDNDRARAHDEARRVIKDLQSKGRATSYLILFDFDSDNLRPISKEILIELSQYLKQEQGLRLRVEGHTCTMGGKEYNLDLSERRAASVKRFLTQECHIEPTRLVPVGYGYSKPADSNATESGRRNNRRVVFEEIKTAPELHE